MQQSTVHITPADMPVSDHTMLRTQSRLNSTNFLLN